MFRRGETDNRWISERLQATETVCDRCGHPILESEIRFKVYIQAMAANFKIWPMTPIQHEEEQVCCHTCVEALFPG